ncbi:unnamed protein product [Brachionus calyciflorus]|uniref:Uncharacterized protein n=1 Tax=Brachionus calyciflorus TaxID=104777 RepID=A0A814E1R5_9BILA|nr:unnamed protein product [Brachionus calyciflorus]
MNPEIISNCFRHCGCRTEPIEYEDDVQIVYSVTSDNEFEKLNENFLNEFGDSDLETFVEADKNLVTCAQAEELLTDNLNEQNNIDSDKENCERIEDEVNIVSKVEALN